MSTPGTRGGVAYLVSRFPKLTETFVLYEILALEGLGVGVELFPLLPRQREGVVHPEAQRLMPRVHFMGLWAWPVVRANLRRLVTQPVRYCRVWWEVVAGNRASPRLLLRALVLWPKMVWLAEALEGLGVRHVHAHFATHATLAALVVHRFTAIPYSFTAHGSDIHKDLTMFGPKLAAAAFGVTVSDYNVEYLATGVGEWVRERLVVVRCGVDPEPFALLPPPGDGEPFAILCVAALKEVKGHRFLLEACARLQAAGVAFVCDLVGEGPLAGELAEMAGALGLGARVRWHGALSRPGVLERLARAHVVVLPSVLGPRGEREGVPVALMEAMAAGRPVVSSRLSGIPELVADGESGLLCPPGDVECLAAALTRLAGDRALGRRLGEVGRRVVAERYHLGRNAARLAQLLERGPGGGAVP